MYIRRQLFRSFCILFVCYLSVQCQRSSPLKVEKDAAVYKLLEEYHHYTDLDQLFQDWSKNYSDIAQTFSIGKSYTGRSLLVLRLSSPMPNEKGKEHDESQLLKPRFKWIGNMHGDETIGREILIGLSYYLLLNSKSDSRVSRILSSTDIYIMPSLNPDGFEDSVEGVCDSQSMHGRGNKISVDLNRDFPSQFSSLKKFKNGTSFDIFHGRQPETVAVMKWILKENFVLSANLHGGSLVASYPYDETISHRDKEYGQSPDDSLFRFLAQTYANKHLTMSKGIDCGAEFKNGVTNGAQWYDVPGGMQDFNYLHSNDFEITIELSCCKYPSAKDGVLQTEWDNNRDALLTYMEMSHMGIKGLIRDVNTREGIADAFIQIEGILHPIRSVETGAYWRLLLPGLHNVTVTAAGYVPQTKYNVNVTNSDPYNALRLDFDLQSVTKGSSSSFVKDVSSINDIYDSLSIISEKLMSDSRDVVLGKLIEPSEPFSYHDYDSMVKKLKQLNSQFPTITSLYTIGKSVEERDLWVMIVSDQPLIHEAGEPEMKYIGNIHGDESVGHECLIRFIEYLCVNYEKNQFITDLVNNVRIHIMPTLNPDGFEFEYRQIDHPQGNGRLNAHHIDLNRNFPHVLLEENLQAKSKNSFVAQTKENSRLDKLTNDKIDLEPEVRAAMHWSLIYPFVLSGNLHGGALVANYPFDGRPDKKSRVESFSPDEETFKMLAKSYSYAHPTMHLGQSCVKFHDGITNGAAWYVVDGGMQDWSYVYTSAMEVTIEMSCTKYPQESTLKSYWDENKGALLAFASQVVHGIRGFVFDSKSKMPLSGATIFVHGIDHNVTSYRDGDFFRLLSSGIYNVTIKRLGYRSETKENVFVGNRSSTYLEFELKRDEISTLDEEKKDPMSKLINSTTNSVQTFFNEAKEFMLHKKFFLFIVAACALLLALSFCVVFVYLRCFSRSSGRPYAGFQRYEPLLQDEEDPIAASRPSQSKTRRVFNESDDDEDNQTLFSSKINKKLIP